MNDEGMIKLSQSHPLPVPRKALSKRKFLPPTRCDFYQTFPLRRSTSAAVVKVSKCISHQGFSKYSPAS